MRTENNQTPAMEKLHDEIEFFVDTIAAPDASDGILHLLLSDEGRSGITPQLTQALYGVMFLLNALDRVQREKKKKSA